MIYLQLFISFIQIGLFSFGGGYAALPLIEHQVIDVNAWLSFTEFTDLVTISQMTPGPIAINAATFVGLKMGGFLGAAVATFGCILPSCIIVSILAYVYMKYKNMAVMQGILSSLRPAVVSLIASAGLSIIIAAVISTSQGHLEVKYDMAVIFILAIILLKVKKMNPVAVMVICGIINTAIYFIL